MEPKVTTSLLQRQKSNMNACITRMLGILQIMFGIASIGLEGSAMALLGKNGLNDIAGGIWVGAWLIITGSVGLWSSYHHRRYCLFGTHLSFSIVALICSAVNGFLFFITMTYFMNKKCFNDWIRDEMTTDKRGQSGNYEYYGSYGNNGISGSYEEYYRNKYKKYNQDNSEKYYKNTDIKEIQDRFKNAPVENWPTIFQSDCTAIDYGKTFYTALGILMTLECIVAFISIIYSCVALRGCCSETREGDCYTKLDSNKVNTVVYRNGETQIYRNNFTYQQPEPQQSQMCNTNPPPYNLYGAPPAEPTAPFDESEFYNRGNFRQTSKTNGIHSDPPSESSAINPAFSLPLSTMTANSMLPFGGSTNTNIGTGIRGTNIGVSTSNPGTVVPGVMNPYGGMGNTNVGSTSIPGVKNPYGGTNSTNIGVSATNPAFAQPPPSAAMSAPASATSPGVMFSPYSVGNSTSIKTSSTNPMSPFGGSTNTKIGTGVGGTNIGVSSTNPGTSIPGVTNPYGGTNSTNIGVSATNPAFSQPPPPAAMTAPTSATPSPGAMFSPYSVGNPTSIKTSSTNPMSPFGGSTSTNIGTVSGGTNIGVSSTNPATNVPSVMNPFGGKNGTNVVVSATNPMSPFGGSTNTNIGV